MYLYEIISFIACLILRNSAFANSNEKTLLGYCYEKLLFHK